MAAATAYEILLGMGGKLDKDLVREFGFAQSIRFNDKRELSQV